MQDARIHLMSIVWTIFIVGAIIQILYWCVIDTLPIVEAWKNFVEISKWDLLKGTFEYLIKVACIWWLIRMEFQLCILYRQSKEFLKNAFELQKSAREEYEEAIRKGAIDEYMKEHGLTSSPGSDAVASDNNQTS